MLKNYLTIAYRTLTRNKGYTFINIFGLAMGLAACLLVGLWVQDELSYDDFHEGADRTYRVAMYYKLPSHGGSTITLTPRPLASELERLFPEVEEASYVAKIPAVVRHEEQRFAEDNFYFAGPGFFEMFSFSLLKGQPGELLQEPWTIVLTESAAEKYFGHEDPIGRMLYVSPEAYYLEEGVFEVTGVVADPPANTHFAFDAVAAMDPAEGAW